MLPDRVSNPGPLTYESGALPIALRGPAHITKHNNILEYIILKCVPVTIPPDVVTRTELLLSLPKEEEHGMLCVS